MEVQHAPSDEPARDDGVREEAGPRAILRVPEVLMAVAAGGAKGVALSDLAARLSVPKTSLHRLMRTLEQGGYLARSGMLYQPGPQAFRLAAMLDQAAPERRWPNCARPVLDWLARETGETVMLSQLSETLSESVYVDVIESAAPLRLVMRPGHRRPLYSVASGKVMLAFRPMAEQQRYLASAEFVRFTDETTGRDEMPAALAAARERGIVFDRNGMVEGAAAIAAPVFDEAGHAFAAFSIAGPTERIAHALDRLEPLVRAAAERLSRQLGWDGPYPAAPGRVPGNR